MKKLAIICTHPIQYYGPWFKRLSDSDAFKIKVFYLWNFGISPKIDRGFKKKIEWDVPILQGYNYEFVPNHSVAGGTHHFFGLYNPSLLRRVDDYRPSAVLLLGYNYASLYYFIWRWNHRTPLIFRGDSHALLPRTGFISWPLNQLISMIFKRFSAFLYVGKANYKYFIDHGVSPQKLFFSPHAVDNDRFFGEAEKARVDADNWKHELEIPQDYKVILFAGKFEPKKRPKDLLDAFVRAKLLKVALLFVGSGPLEASLKSAAVSCPRVYFAPFQNQSFMPRTYAVSDLFVLPSYGKNETWGLSVNEAMCMSRPIIVSDHVGCYKDLVVPFRNGLIFKAGDVQDLSKCLSEALSDHDRLRRWGQESRSLVSSYNYKESTSGLKSALADLGVL